MKGLPFRKTADAIAAFVKEHGAVGPRRAVLCTYDLQPERFEAVILPELTRRRRWFRTLVLADRAALQQDGVLGARSTASSYEVAPVHLNGPGVFHPKLLVLQAGARMLIGIGSANLTRGGLGGNLELMLFTSDTSADGRAIAESAVHFLDELRRVPNLTSGSARRFLERLCVSRPHTQDGPVLHNLREPLIEQMERGRPPRVARTAVISPWHSSAACAAGVEPRVLAAVGRALGARPVVHTEGARGKGPDLGKNVRVRILKPTTTDGSGELETDDEDQDDAPAPPRRPATLHAKAYIAIGKRTSALWFGSANCTTPALLETARGRGNVELLVRVELRRSAVAALDTDLQSMFDDRKGVLTMERNKRFLSQSGWVLSGLVSSSGQQPGLTLDLVPSTTARTLRISRSAKRGGVIEVRVPRGAQATMIDGQVLAKLLDGGELPPVLWEHVKATAVRFPVSVPCVPIADNAEEVLDDLLDDLAGRPPSRTGVMGRKRPADGDDDMDDLDDERDRELDLLTKTEHEGILDRIAVRVERLRHRLAAAPWSTPASHAHYRSAIENLEVAPPLRRILIHHLEVARSAR